MNTVIYIVIVLIILAVFGKWIVIGFVFPFQVLYGHYLLSPTRFNRILAFPFRVWEKIFRGGWQRYMLFQVAFIPSMHVRRGIYKVLGCRMGRKNVFYYGTEIREITQLQLGTGNYIGDRAILDARRGIKIGNNVNISSGVSIYTLQHDHRSPSFACRPEGGEVIIGDRVWLGPNVIVLPGVRIGEGAICCAGCVVTKDVEPFTVVAGIPAKKVNERTHELTYVFNGKSCRIY